MYNITRLHNVTLKQSLKTLATAVRCNSQKTLLPKPILARVLCNPRNVLGLEASKKYFSSFSSFRSNVSTYNEKIIGKKKLHNLASKEGFKTSPLDVNTAVLNNVLLYKNDKPTFFKFVNLFAPFQCVFWTWLGYFIYTKLPERHTSLREYLKDTWIWLMISGSAVFLGTTSLVFLWMYTSKSIRYIILKAGGQEITFLTYHPWRGNVGITAPIASVSSRIPRKEMINYLTIKLKGRSFFYILDSGGEFINPKLYDHTVGLVRHS